MTFFFSDPVHGGQVQERALHRQQQPQRNLLRGVSCINDCQAIKSLSKLFPLYSNECAQRGGSSAGSCAAGYGVCCTFTIGCGGTSSENCTYFQSGGSEIGQCCATICPCGDNICQVRRHDLTSGMWYSYWQCQLLQIRLDFNTFVITGPSTSTVVVGKTLNGILTDSEKTTRGCTYVGAQLRGSDPRCGRSQWDLCVSADAVLDRHLLRDDTGKRRPSRHLRIQHWGSQ